MTQSYDELVAKYGEDNASFLYDQLCDMTRNYSGMTFIEMGIEPDDRFERQARSRSGRARLEVPKVAGDMESDPAIGRRPLGCRPFSGGSRRATTWRPAMTSKSSRSKWERVQGRNPPFESFKELAMNGYQRVLALFDGNGP